MNVLILGGNGLIGSALVQALVSRGYVVTALCRNGLEAQRRMPGAQWRKADLAQFKTPDDWQPLLQGQDAIINAAGLLQDGPRDDVVAVQDVAMRALYKAAAAETLIVQITARTEAAGSETAFMSSKRAADSALKASGLPWVILRPAIVVGRHAYGGTALLRSLAAIPVVSPLASPGSLLQFAALDDVVDTTIAALAGTISPGSDIEIAGPQRHTLAEAVALHRQWLGLPPVSTIRIPDAAARIVSACADFAGRLGWRSPLRSTALQIASGGVTSSTDGRWRNLEDVLAAYPAGVADLWFARLYLLKPLIIGVLALFWLLSGLIALTKFNDAASYLSAIGLPSTIAAVLTIATSLADIALGLGAVVRRYSGVALKGMIVLSLVYLGLATVTAPELWAHPLGPLVKVLPSLVLTLIALAILDDR